MRVAVLLMVAIMASPLAGGAVGPETRDPAIPAAPPGLVDWHPLSQSNLVYWDFGIDRGRDRVLIVGAVRDIMRNVELLVLNASGTFVTNVTLAWPVYAPTLAVDPSTGYSFVSSLASTIQRVDTVTGAILDVWSYPFAVQSMAVGGGRIYVATGGNPIQVIDATTGAVLGNLSATPPVPYNDLIVDPSGRWLLASYGNVQAFATNLANGTTTALPIRGATFATSKDGFIYVCAAPLSFQGSFLHTFSPQNGTLEFHPVACVGALDENPMTGVVVDARGNLIRPNGTVGRVLFLGSRRFAGFGWRADGHVLAGVIDSAFTFEIGSWDGSPRLAVFPAGRVLFSSRFFPYCFFLQSVTGMNTSTVRGYLDASATPLPLDLADAFDCIPMDGVADGFHTLHVVGTDLLGLPLDDFLNFETDGTVPTIDILSATIRGDGTYELRGWANDTHLESVLVNGEAAEVIGNEWVIRPRLAIGNNSFLIYAVDVPGNSASTQVDLRYWPAYAERASNTTGRFSLPIPPGWTSTVPAGLTTGSGVTLYGPAEAEGTVVVSLLSLRDPAAVADPQYAVDRVQESISVIESLGATVFEPAHAITVANHSAATLKALLVTGSGGQIYVQTAIVVPEWERTIFIAVVIPEAAMASHSEDVTWILEGFQIDALPTPPTPAGLPVLWIGAAAAAIGAAVALSGVLVVRKRKKRPPTKVPETNAGRT